MKFALGRRILPWLTVGLLALPLLLAPPVAVAAPSLADVQVQVQLLQEEAASAAEGAQSAKVELANLSKTLASVKQEAAVQGSTVAKLKDSLGAIAIEQYKSGGLSQSLELLFSADPTLYLSAAGSLDALTRRKSLQLHRYAAAQQRLNATTLTVNDKLALVAAAQARITKQLATAQYKLKAAEILLTKLKKSDRARLAKLALMKENADHASSLNFAKSASGISGRAGVALKFALAQIGDWYVFGAAGMVYWDCSGLTMRAYQKAGVSMPHSAAAQERTAHRCAS
ncbi:MAG: NlpC/P60 family protein [Actinobacteria bacterium]|nr:NlpC/P60 family protein [Actinomycetota bacterium]